MIALFLSTEWGRKNVAAAIAFGVLSDFVLGILFSRLLLSLL